MNANAHDYRRRSAAAVMAGGRLPVPPRGRLPVSPFGRLPVSPSRRMPAPSSAPEARGMGGPLAASAHPRERT